MMIRPKNENIFHYTHDMYLQAWAFMAPLISWPLLRQSFVTVYIPHLLIQSTTLVYICWMMMMM